MNVITTRVTPLGASLLAAALLTSAVSAQNVGIGTTTPKSKLSVNGTTASGGMAIGDATYTSTTGIVAPLNGAIVQGRVGIGTTNPLMRLHLEGDGSTNLDTALYINSLAPVPSLNQAPQVLLRATNHAALPLDSIFGRFLVQAPGTASNNTGWDAIYRGLSGTDGLSAIAFRTVGTTGSLERMRISETGNVGIGDSTPVEAQLVVRGAETGTITGGRTQFSYNSSGLLTVAPNFAIAPSIYASSAIVAEGNLIAGISVIAANTITLSDERLKNIVRESDNAADLETLGKIRITDYTMKDSSVLGGGELKKVIAQQVEEVYPRAVTKTSGYLPDVYSVGTVAAKGDGLFEVRVDASPKLEAGAKVKLLTGNGEAVFATVESAGEKTFTAKLKSVSDGDKIFVYGRQVDDLRTVDYDALSMLNISATQELARNVTDLKTENAGLKQQVSDLKAANDKLTTLSAEMDALKQTVAAMRSKDEGEVRTVSLTK